MAFNSDGYIMVDFTEVDFTRTNQTIDGLFERVKSVVGTNKFVLVINANHRTPLPATVTITNNHYVIQAVVYTFSIASNDLLHIQRNYPPESDLIQDDVISILTTWSSYKINEEMQGKTEIDDNIISNSSTWSSLNILQQLLPHETQTGAVVTITDGISELGFIDVKANITPVQASGTPTPSNPLPISGWSEINITVNDDISDPQTENVYIIQLGNTYYGGVLDVTTGVLRVTTRVLDLSTLSWNVDGQRMRARQLNLNINDMSLFKCNCLNPTNEPNLGSRNDWDITYIKNNYYPLDCKVPSGTTVSSFVDLMSDIDGNGTHGMLVIGVDKPTEIQLTPTQIAQLNGNNNVFADSGDVEVTYYATIQGYIDSKLSANRSLPTLDLRNSINIEDTKTNEQEDTEK